MAIPLSYLSRHDKPSGLSRSLEIQITRFLIGKTREELLLPGCRIENNISCSASI